MQQTNCSLYCPLVTSQPRIISTVMGITVFVSSFVKNNLMPVIICKNDRHLVTLYNVIFENITGILSYLSYVFY